MPVILALAYYREELDAILRHCDTPMGRFALWQQAAILARKGRRIHIKQL